MLRSGHQTAQCPSCEKDSWQSSHAAFFRPVQCMWCKAKFQWDKETESYKVITEGETDGE